jgi:hypothetical protein
MGELSTISFLISDRERKYTGVELRPHFLLQELGLKGSGIGIFTGACEVKTEHLVDWEDRLANDKIQARSMIHFIGEFFGMSLNEGVLTQRFLMATMADILNDELAAAHKSQAQSLSERLPERLPERLNVRRSGDDLFVSDRKLSVSIVTASPVSILLHAGINIDPEGAPVPAIGLKEIGVASEVFTSRVKERFLEEWSDMKWACTKVRPVV